MNANPTQNFASDNNSGVHPAVMQALAQANTGHCVGYGDDPWTAQAEQTIKSEFGPNTEVYFVYNGTGANILGLKAVTNSFNAVICADTAHINVDECGAPEHFGGFKLIAVPAADGKLTPELVKKQLVGIGFEHHSQPAVVSITQSTELGTLYSLDELTTLADFCHKHNLVLHMDGARLANAAVALNCSLAQTSVQAGVDILSFGGTKNGLMFGEALLFFSNRPHVRYWRKQAAQLHSKMRFIATQFNCLLKNNLWHNNAQHANGMAQLLYQKVKSIPGVAVTRAPQVNSLFVTLPAQVIPKLQQEYFFYVWDEHTNEVRFMTSFDTTVESIEGFVAALAKLMA